MLPLVAIVATVLHVIVTVVAVAVDGVPRTVLAVGAVGAFFVGAGAFAVAFVLAASRSRTEQLWFGGVFFLTGGVVPADVRRTLLGCLAAQVIVGLAGATLAPFTPVAFGVLVPLLGLGLVALEGARRGEFSPRPDSE